MSSAVLGAVGGSMLLWTVYWAFRLLARKEGMGFGDFKLLAAIGAWTGWQVLPVAIIVSAGLGAGIGSLGRGLGQKGFGPRVPPRPHPPGGGPVPPPWGPRVAARGRARLPH